MRGDYETTLTVPRYVKGPYPHVVFRDCSGGALLGNVVRPLDQRLLPSPYAYTSGTSRARSRCSPSRSDCFRSPGCRTVFSLRRDCTARSRGLAVQALRSVAASMRTTRCCSGVGSKKVAGSSAHICGGFPLANRQRFPRLTPCAEQYLFMSETAESSASTCGAAILRVYRWRPCTRTFRPSKALVTASQSFVTSGSRAAS